MKKGIKWWIVGAFLMAGLFVINGSRAEEAKITVLNPLGQPPALKLIPMAPRLDTLEGKTIYVVDTGYPETKPFLEEMVNLFSAAYPRTKWILRNKIGTYFEDDPDLWKEIKSKGNGMIIAVGH
ncbi:MAG: hypothetical protein ABSD38_20275 [Syntrophorhabdales bacterium]|jgi:hypothetical protein